MYTMEAITMNIRTQVYLDEKQRRALKMLSASTDQSVSDLVRRAIDRLLSDEFVGKDWGTEMSALVGRLRKDGPELSEAAAIRAVEKQRARRRRAKKTT
jgi:Arc/MetJ-type ribon-helix-helix transcriptional regulator